MHGSHAACWVVMRLLCLGTWQSCMQQVACEKVAGRHVGSISLVDARIVACRVLLHGKFFVVEGGAAVEGLSRAGFAVIIGEGTVCYKRDWI